MIKNVFSVACFALILTSCPHTNKLNGGKAYKGLKDYYSTYFPIGAAVSPQALKTDEAQLIIREFNTMTPENTMKMKLIHPKENEYYREMLLPLATE
jgi:endo-1,4-beta-xylanase